jgi:hypothetical protein
MQSNQQELPVVWGSDSFRPRGRLLVGKASFVPAQTNTRDNENVT